jgi:hypothetical protein
MMTLVGWAIEGWNGYWVGGWGDRRGWVVQSSRENLLRQVVTEEKLLR